GLAAGGHRGVGRGRGPPDAEVLRAVARPPSGRDRRERPPRSDPAKNARNSAGFQHTGPRPGRSKVSGTFDRADERRRGAKPEHARDAPERPRRPDRPPDGRSKVSGTFERPERPLREDLVMQASLEAYGAVRHEGWLADRALDHVLRAKRHLYSNERRAVAERV